MNPKFDPRAFDGSGGFDSQNKSFGHKTSIQDQLNPVMLQNFGQEEAKNQFLNQRQFDQNSVNSFGNKNSFNQNSFNPANNYNQQNR